MPMSDFATVELAIAAFLIVAGCGLGLIALVAALFEAIDARSSRAALAPSCQVTPARRPISR
jgi:hypothetical protein